MVCIDDKELCSFCFSEMPKGAERCECCQKLQSDAEQVTDYLPIGTILSGEYLIGHVLGHGGFGATYLGFDLKQKRRVAIKEYFPGRWSYRVCGEENIQIKTSGEAEKFQEGAERFYNEAKNIAMFEDNPNIIDIYSFFYENNTCYFVMEYIEGITLKDYVAGKGGRIEPAECCKLLLPLLDAMEAMHAQNVLHRDISPDNIYITTDGSLKLLDFGAARQKMDEAPKSLSVVLKQGFAPIEQYQRKGKQGAWTDVYAFAATIYYCVTGTVPKTVTERIGDDQLPSLRELGILPETNFSDIIEKAMAIQVVNRVQSAKELKTLIEPYANGMTVKAGKKHFEGLGGLFKNKKYIAIAGSIAAVLIVGIVLKFTVFQQKPSDELAAESPVEESVEKTETASEVNIASVPSDKLEEAKEPDTGNEVLEGTPKETESTEETAEVSAENTEALVEYVKWSEKKVGKAVAKVLSVEEDQVTEDMLQKVEKLTFKEVKLKNFDDFSKLENLSELTIERGELKSIKELKKLKKLRKLSLKHNLIKNLDGIEELKELVSLDLEDNILKDISPIAKLKKLENLNLENNEIRDIKDLKKLTNLKKLNLRRNNIVDTTTMKVLSSKVKDYKGKRTDQKNYQEVKPTLQPVSEPAWTPEPTQAPVYVAPTPAPTPTPAPARDEWVATPW